ncbi:TrmH family RNA methyltransferase [Allopusillimonas ginsengisoli]|uniref:TrmH family RNA methyltransferase n=1 Tax=Allopusillimonas ginsengisoli TaxID=453575 RepID=UPI0010215FF2|nr:RNA methyltransferase [Allopusillimonas ginsengisoli]TEA77633.1 RNA methyltransferase [Allopusillimonas ginsengisoli]
MKYISSRDNAVFKYLSRVAAGKHGVGEGRQVLLEGTHLCQAWLRFQGPPERAIFDDSRLAESKELQALAQSLDTAICIACDERLARNLSQVEHGQGVYFLVTPPNPGVPDRIDHLCLWLDRIQDPGNVGTLLRTAAAVGIEHAYLSVGTASAWSAKVLRSAQGAHFVMQIHERVDLLGACDRLAVPLIATALNEAVALYDLALPERCAWLLGNEGQGVAPQLLAQAKTRVFIPQAEGVESLNVAVAAGVCLFEQRRQTFAAHR